MSERARPRRRRSCAPRSATGFGRRSPWRRSRRSGSAGRPRCTWSRRPSDDLVAAGEAIVATGVPFVVLGKGSNVLVADAGFPGLVLRLGRGFRWAARDGRTADRGRRDAPARARRRGPAPRPRRAGVRRRDPGDARWSRPHERGRPRRGDGGRRRARSDVFRLARGRARDDPGRRRRVSRTGDRPCRTTRWSSARVVRLAAGDATAIRARDGRGAGVAPADAAARRAELRERVQEPRRGPRRSAGRGGGRRRACGSAAPRSRRSTRTSSWRTRGARGRRPGADPTRSRRWSRTRAGITLEPEVQLIGAFVMPTLPRSLDRSRSAVRRSVGRRRRPRAPSRRRVTRRRSALHARLRPPAHGRPAIAHASGRRGRRSRELRSPSSRQPIDVRDVDCSATCCGIARRRDERRHAGRRRGRASRSKRPVDRRRDGHDAICRTDRRSRSASGSRCAVVGADGCRARRGRRQRPRRRAAVGSPAAGHRRIAAAVPEPTTARRVCGAARASPPWSPTAPAPRSTARRRRADGQLRCDLASGGVASVDGDRARSRRRDGPRRRSSTRADEERVRMSADVDAVPSAPHRGPDRRTWSGSRDRASCHRAAQRALAHDA